MGQSAINDLMDFKDTRREIAAGKNDQIDSLFHCMLYENYDNAKSFLPAKHRDFFIESIQEELSEYVEKYGKLNNYKIGGTVRWQDPNYKTVVYLQFEQKTVDMTFVWIDDALYETIRENEMGFHKGRQHT